MSDNLQQVSLLLSTTAFAVLDYNLRLTEMLNEIEECLNLGCTEILSTFVDDTEDAVQEMHQSVATKGLWKQLPDRPNMYSSMTQDEQGDIITRLEKVADLLVGQYPRLALLLSSVSCTFSTADRETLEEFLSVTSAAVVRLRDGKNQNLRNFIKEQERSK